MDTPTFQVDDLVMIADDFARPADRGVIYRVTRKLMVNLALEPVAGGRRVHAHPQVLVPAPPETDPKTTPVTDLPYQPPLYRGQIVTVAGPGWRKPAGQLYVVLKHRQDDKVNIAKLGGEASGRYWPSVPAACSRSSNPIRSSGRSAAHRSMPQPRRAPSSGLQRP